MTQELAPLFFVVAVLVSGLLGAAIVVTGVWLGVRIGWRLLRPEHPWLSLWGRKAEPEIEQEETD